MNYNNFIYSYTQGLGILTKVNLSNKSKTFYFYKTGYEQELTLLQIGSNETDPDKLKARIDSLISSGKQFIIDELLKKEIKEVETKNNASIDDPLSMLGLESYTLILLNSYKIKKINDLLSFNKSTLLSMQGMTQMIFNEIDSKLKEIGYKIND